MEKKYDMLISALDAIAFTRESDPAKLKLWARNALKGFESAQHRVQSDLKPCTHGDMYLIGDPPFCTECVLDEEAASSR